MYRSFTCCRFASEAAACARMTGDLLLPRLLLQPFNLFEMARAVCPHPFDQLGHGKVLLRLGVIGRLGEVRRFETLQPSQICMAIQPVERDQFGRWSL